MLDKYKVIWFIINVFLHVALNIILANCSFILFIFALRFQTVDVVLVLGVQALVQFGGLVDLLDDLHIFQVVLEFSVGYLAFLVDVCFLLVRFPIVDVICYKYLSILKFLF